VAGFLIDPGARQTPSFRAMENVNIMSITQIIIQSQYARSPEAIAIRTAITLDRAGIRVVNSDDPGCDISELPVGSVEFVLSGLRKRLVKAPPVIDYPAPLKRFLLREIRSSILINEIGGEAWIKTRGHENHLSQALRIAPTFVGSIRKHWFTHPHSFAGYVNGAATSPTVVFFGESAMILTGRMMRQSQASA